MPIKKQGFTLVELSIVLVIVGLLIGGILVGQSLIQAAMINSTVREFQQYSILIANYKNKFKAYPGDDPNGWTYYSTKCSQYGLTASTCTGDSNKQIDYYESTKLYYHLYFADFLKKPPTILKSEFSTYSGQKSAFSGILGATFLAAGYAPATSASTLFIMYQGAKAGNHLALMADNDIAGSHGGLSPIEASAIDNKLDDGKPLSGNLWGGSVGDGTGGGCLNSSFNITRDVLPVGAASNAYRVSDKTRRCAIFYFYE